MEALKPKPTNHRELRKTEKGNFTGNWLSAIASK
jgi:hypothetical protein